MAKMNKEKREEDEFKPKGTVAVLALFVLTMLLLWGYVYLTLISRGVTV